MIKNLAISFCFLSVGFVFYLLVPTQTSSSSIYSEEFLPEEPTSFAPDFANNQKCDGRDLYIKQGKLGTLTRKLSMKGVRGFKQKS